MTRVATILSTRNEIDQITTFIKSRFNPVAGTTWSPVQKPLHSPEREKTVAVKKIRQEDKEEQTGWKAFTQTDKSNRRAIRSKKKKNQISSLFFSSSKLFSNRHGASPAGQSSIVETRSEEGRKGALYRIMSQFPGGRGEVAHVVVSFHPAGTGCRRAVN